MTPTLMSVKHTVPKDTRTNKHKSINRSCIANICITGRDRMSQLGLMNMYPILHDKTR